MRSTEHQDFLGIVWQEAGCLEEGPTCPRRYKSHFPALSQNITELLGLREEESVRLVTGENWRECRKIHIGKGPNLYTETSPRLQAVLRV